MEGYVMDSAPRAFLFRLLIFSTCLAGVVTADEVIFLNGDRLTGKILSVADGELVLETDGAGEVTIKLGKLKTFSSDQPVKIRVGDKPPFNTKVTAGAPGYVGTQASPQPLAIQDITAINPPVLAWHGEIALNAMLQRGNTHREEIGFEFELEKKWEKHQLFFGGEYFYGRERNDQGSTSTTDNYGEGFIRYRRIITEKFYAGARGHVWHDSLADLNLRYMVGPGIGYQWFDNPKLTFYTEAGVAYNDENYDPGGTEEYWGPYLAYGFEWTPVKPLKLFSELEYLPSFSNFTDDYLLDVNGGIHTKIWKGLFAQFRVEYLYDSHPAPGADHWDLRFILGPGWEF
jgi:hypothetical protein